MTTTQQAEFIQSLNGELTPEQAAQLLELGEGDTGIVLPDDGGAPGTPAAQPAAVADSEAEGSQNSTEDDGSRGAGEEPDPANTVILARDGKHTISYDKLVEAREAAKAERARADEAERRAQEALQELERLKQEAKLRADAGQAPTMTDSQVAAAEAAIEAGVDPGIFGDFSEEALAKGIQTLIDQKVAAQVEAILAQKLAPIQQAQQIEAAKAHYAAIYEAHPDADSIAESKELADWIASQPSFVRDSYQAVLSNGTTAQVIELFDTFKKATGATRRAAAPSPGDVKAAAKAVIDKAKPPVPASLSDIPGGRPGAAATREDAMAEMGGLELLDAMQDMTPEQIEEFLNRRI